MGKLPGFRVLLLLAFLAAGGLSHAQTGVWTGQPSGVIRLRTGETGLYRVQQDALRQAGLPAGTDPRTFRMFHHGQEIAIRIAGEADGRFDGPDFLEFFGKAADGTLDSALYHPREAQPHRFYNLYTDTTAYFLTWGERPGLRVHEVGESVDEHLPPVPFVWVSQRDLFTGDYAVGTFYPPGARTWNAQFLTHADWGEAYAGPGYQPGQAVSFGFDLSFFARNAGIAPRLDLQLLGRNPDPHGVDVTVGPTGTERFVDSLGWTGFRPRNFRAELRLSDVAANDALRVGLRVRDGSSPGGVGVLPWAFSPTYLAVRYPAQPVLFAPELAFELPGNSPGRARLRISNVPEGSELYDLTDERQPARIRVSLKNATLETVMPEARQPRRLLLTSRFLTAPAQPVTFRSFPLKASFLVVTHEGLLGAARTYAAYRASAAGGGNDTLVVTMAELADRFNHGEWSPLAIRTFAEAARRQAGAKFLLLIGQGRWPQAVRRAPNRAALDPVPPAGWPAADLPHAMGLGNDSPFAPGLAVGRLNAATPAQVLAYLDKVREHEAAPATDLWRKRMLHLSGGRSADELRLFRSFVDGFAKTAQTGGVGAKVQTLGKQTDAPVEFFNVSETLNAGVGLVTFFGHSGGGGADLDIGRASDEAASYRNRGRYPLLLVNGCDAGDIFLDGGQTTFGTDWVNAPGRGAIAVLAHAAAGYPEPLRDFTRHLYDVLFADSAFVGVSVGIAHAEAARRLAGQPGAGVFEQAHAHQFVLQGDPAVVIFPAKKPDYAVESLVFPEKPTAFADSLRLAVVVTNGGRVPNGTVAVSVLRKFGDGTVAEIGPFALPPVAFRDTLRFSVKNDRTRAAGPNRFEVLLDPDRHLDESTRDNNAAALDVNLPGFAALPLLPPNGAMVSEPTVSLTAQATRVLPEKTQNFLVEIDTSAAFTSPFRRSQVVAHEWLPVWETALPPTEGQRYFWRVRAADQPESPANDWAGSSFVFRKNRAEPARPEGVVVPVAERVEVPEGAMFRQKLRFQNLTNRPFADSLLVRQILTHGPTRRQSVRTWRVAPPPPGGSTEAETVFDTRGFVGQNTLRLAFNADNQPEVSWANNFAEIAVGVLPDRANPRLEVTFDGRFIEHGELVSARPTIAVRLTDENPFLPLPDTLALTLRWQPPGERWTRVAFSQARVSWKKGPGNAVQATFRPGPLPDGRYAFEVQGRDASGNQAGGEPYRIGFTVKRDSVAAGVFPNPFSEFTRFWVALGEAPPEAGRVRVFNAAGLLVRELRAPEPKAGLTEWLWDGTDGGGAPLPGGLYFFRIGTGTFVRTGRLMLVR